MIQPAFELAFLRPSLAWCEPVSFLAALRRVTRNNGVLYNPAADLDLPKVEERLPKHVLTIEEVERVPNLPDTTTALGVGDDGSQSQAVSRFASHCSQRLPRVLDLGPLGRGGQSALASPLLLGAINPS